MDQGNIILLNGTSSSGKTTIAQALQASLEQPYLHTGIDHFIRRYPSELIVFNDGNKPVRAEGWLAVVQDGALSRVEIGPVGFGLIAGMYRAIAALAQAGIHTIVDDVIYDERVLREAVAVLHPHRVWFVGIRCPLEVTERREQARGDRLPGGARTFHDRVHVHGIYDIEVDSASHGVQECARQIVQGMQDNPTPDALRRLKRVLIEGQGRSPSDGPNRPHYTLPL